LYFWLFSRLPRRLQVIAFNDGNQLTGLHILPFVHGKRLNAPRNLGADHHFVRIYRADQLQVARRPDGDKVPDQRSNG
jgi:hypothetical protein